MDKSRSRAGRTEKMVDHVFRPRIVLVEITLWKMFFFCGISRLCYEFWVEYSPSQSPCWFRWG
jgi:hypothetical protein